MNRQACPTYTERLEARAAWYAAMSLDLEGRLEDAQSLGEALRVQTLLERLEDQGDAEGLAGLVEAARDALAHDAERVQELLNEGKPRRPLPR